jgi:hypothetical protein
MLGGGDQIAFPSGYIVKLQPIKKKHITVDLKNGGIGRDDVFDDIMSEDSAKIAKQKKRWQDEGIKYTKSVDEAEKYKLGLPIHNMNDILFAHLFQASDFGNRRIYDDGSFGTALVYAGHQEAYLRGISVNGSKFLHRMARLKKQAIFQRKLGHRYMHVVTESSDSIHAENIDIDALLALKPNNMEIGKAYAIGDRNYWDYDMSQNIPHLAVRKVDATTPTYELGTLRGSRFKKEDLSTFYIYTTGIEKHDAQYWEQFCN